ncbi:hypothetical protein [Marinobacter sp. LV10R510-11A]|uniref:hypothetical protein n=1 Tax=Marinobacter sp. LV10R510-11A TaxID=1415568 RepID=UPI000BB83CDE|nr:hypothetical protein [Marinobacter sp. LV10R510-11A]
MGILIIRHADADIVFGGSGIIGGNDNRTGRNIDAVCKRIDTDNGYCRYQYQFKGGASENR